MKFVFEGIPVSAGCRESKDGKRYYDISVDCEGELVTMSADQEVYNAFKDAKYKPCRFIGAYQKGEYQGRTYTRLSVVALALQK